MKVFGQIDTVTISGKVELNWFRHAVNRFEESPLTMFFVQPGWASL